MTSLLLTVLLPVWALCMTLAVSLCVVSARAQRAPERGALRLVHSR